MLLPLSVLQLSADASGRHHDKRCFVMTKEEYPVYVATLISSSTECRRFRSAS
jgi:hypothetical protein